MFDDAIWFIYIILYSYFSDFYDSMAIFTRGKVGPWPTSQRWVQHGPSASFSSFAPSSSVPTASRPPRGVLRCSAGAGCVASWLVVVIRDFKSWINCIRNCRIPYVPWCWNMSLHVWMLVNIPYWDCLSHPKKQWKATGTSTFMTIALDELDCPAVKNHHQQWHTVVLC